MKLHLQLNLDELGPEYQTADTPYYALIVSAALEPDPGETLDAAAVRKLLKLWTWRPFELAVYGRPEDYSTPWQALDHVLVTDDAPPANIDAMRTLLDAEMEAQLAAFEANDFIWTPNPQAARIETTHMTGGADPRRGRDWRAFLTHVGSYPDGLGIELGLTAFFHLRQRPAAGVIVAAAPSVQFDVIGAMARPGEPIDPQNATGPPNPLQPIDLPNAPGAKQVFRWTYTAHPDVTIDAYVNRPKPIPPVTADTMLDLRTQWRQQRAIGPASNWLAQLAERIAPSVDLPSVLLDGLRSLGDAPAPSEFRDRFRRGLFETVRAAVDASRVPPSGATLLETVLYRFAPSTDFALEDKIPKDWEEERLPKAGTSNAARYARAVDQYWTQFQTKTGLADRIMSLWQAAYRGATAWDSFADKVRATLEVDALRERLLLHNLGTFWRSLVPAGASTIGGELSDLRITLEGKAREFAELVLDGLPDRDRDALLRVVATVLAKPEDQLSGDPTSDGLTIQIDTHGSAGEVGGRDDHEDLLRRISGAGVLMRRQGVQEWRCLNMVNLFVRTAKEGPAATQINGTMAWPVRFQYVGGLRQCFLTYQNQPLAAESPWASLSLQQPVPLDGVPGLDRMFSLQSPYRRDQPWKLERLEYGVTYETAVFYFSTAGALPAELCEGFGTANVKPWRFALPAPAAPPPVVITHEYRRRCPIGALRLAADPVIRQPFPPELPEEVYPITSLFVRDHDGTMSGLTSAAPAASDIPLVVLLPSPTTDDWDHTRGRASSSLIVRPPSVDVKVWLRWQANASPAQPGVSGPARVLEDLFTLFNAHAVGTRTTDDATLDESAVTGFTVSFVPIFSRGMTGDPTADVVFDFETPAAGTGLKSQQHRGRSVVIESTPDQKPAALLDNDRLKITIPNGTAWRVDLTPVIDRLDRFTDDETLRASLRQPTSIHVEVTAPLFERETYQLCNERLHGALHAGLTESAEQGLGLLATLDRGLSASFGPLIHRTELLVQKWRWDGRPVYESPTAPNGALSSGLPFARFEQPEDIGDDPPIDGMLFAERDDTDGLIVPGAVDLASPRDDFNLRHRINLYVLPFGAELGVLYYRLALRAFSRYEGLLRHRTPLDSSVSPSQVRRWKRCVVPLRWRDRVPKPLVKLIVPLTEAVNGLGANRNAPGWLVFLDEAWYSPGMGGLGEILESAIDRVALPDDATQERLQFGPDAIVDMPIDPHPDPEEVKWQQPIGASGWTFDTDTSAPLFGKVAFYQPPPEIANLTRDLSFYFVRLRFQRALAGADPANPRDRSNWLRSEPTDPFWIQVLPPANRWRVTVASGTTDWVSIDDLQIAPAIDGLTCGGERVNAVHATRTTSKVGTFLVYALITRRVFDAFGRPHQEAFVDLTPVEKIAAPSGVRAGQLVLRLVEVQFRLGPQLPTTLGELLDALFHGYRDPNFTPSDDASGRIVRISPPLTPD